MRVNSATWSHSRTFHFLSTTMFLANGHHLAFQTEHVTLQTKYKKGNRSHVSNNALWRGQWTVCKQSSNTQLNWPLTSTWEVPGSHAASVIGYPGRWFVGFHYALQASAATVSANRLLPLPSKPFSTQYSQLPHHLVQCYTTSADQSVIS